MYCEDAIDSHFNDIFPPTASVDDKFIKYVINVKVEMEMEISIHQRNRIIFSIIFFLLLFQSKMKKNGCTKWGGDVQFLCNMHTHSLRKLKSNDNKTLQHIEMCISSREWIPRKDIIFFFNLQTVWAVLLLLHFFYSSFFPKQNNVFSILKSHVINRNHIFNEKTLSISDLIWLNLFECFNSVECKCETRQRFIIEIYVCLLLLLLL